MYNRGQNCVEKTPHNTNTYTPLLVHSTVIRNHFTVHICPILSWHNVGLPASSAHSVAISVLDSSYMKKAEVAGNLRVRIDVEDLTVAGVLDERSKYQFRLKIHYVIGQIVKKR